MVRAGAVPRRCSFASISWSVGILGLCRFLGRRGILCLGGLRSFICDHLNGLLFRLLICVVLLRNDGLGLILLPIGIGQCFVPVDPQLHLFLGNIRATAQLMTVLAGFGVATRSINP